MERIRSFIAIDIDDPSLRKRLEDIEAQLSKLSTRIKIVEPQNLHLTLYFLGEIPLNILREVEKILEKIEYQPFRITIEKLGAFPSIYNPRVVWVGVTRGSEHIEKIYNDLISQIRTLGFKPDPRGFSPHITLGRVKSKSRDDLIQFLKEHQDIYIGSMEVTEIRLKKSVLTSRGPIYSTLYSKKLVA